MGETIDGPSQSTFDEFRAVPRIVKIQVNRERNSATRSAMNWNFEMDTQVGQVDTVNAIGRDCAACRYAWRSDLCILGQRGGMEDDQEAHQKSDSERARKNFGTEIGRASCRERV